MNRSKWWRAAIAAISAAMLFAAAAPIHCRAQTTPLRDKQEISGRVEELAGKFRFGEAQRLLDRFEAKTGEKLQAAHDAITSEFSSYVKNPRSEGQSYLFWFFGILQPRGLTIISDYGPIPPVV